MRSHFYAVGEHVLYTERRFPHLVCKEPYTILRCVNSKRAEPQYRIRSEYAAQERLASENELSRDALPMKRYGDPGISGFMDCTGMDEAANVNLVPLDVLPRRAWHKNERGSSRGRFHA